MKLQFVRASDIDLWSGRVQEGEIVKPTRPPTTVWERFIDKMF